MRHVYMKAFKMKFIKKIILLKNFHIIFHSLILRAILQALENADGAKRLRASEAETALSSILITVYVTYTYMYYIIYLLSLAETVLTATILNF